MVRDTDSEEMQSPKLNFLRAVEVLNILVQTHRIGSCQVCQFPIIFDEVYY